MPLIVWTWPLIEKLLLGGFSAKLIWDFMSSMLGGDEEPTAPGESAATAAQLALGDVMSAGKSVDTSISPALAYMLQEAQTIASNPARFGHYDLAPNKTKEVADMLSEYSGVPIRPERVRTAVAPPPLPLGLRIYGESARALIDPPTPSPGGMAAGLATPLTEDFSAPGDSDLDAIRAIMSSQTPPEPVPDDLHDSVYRPVAYAKRKRQEKARK